MASINNWNFLPNLHYYCEIRNNTVDFRVYIYKTLADAQAQTDFIAFSTGNAFGSNIGIVLTLAGTSFIISKFDDTNAYHLQVTFALAESNTIFHVSPFHDGELQDELLTTDAMILTRSTREINVGTHVKSVKDIKLNHSPGRYDGNVIKLDTTDYIDNDNKVETLRIIWDGNKLFDDIAMYSYENLVFYEVT